MNQGSTTEFSKCGRICEPSSSYTIRFTWLSSSSSRSSVSNDGHMRFRHATCRSPLPSVHLVILVVDCLRVAQRSTHADYLNATLRRFSLPRPLLAHTRYSTTPDRQNMSDSLFHLSPELSMSNTSHERFESGAPINHQGTNSSTDAALNRSITITSSHGEVSFRNEQIISQLRGEIRVLEAALARGLEDARRERDHLNRKFDTLQLACADSLEAARIGREQREQLNNQINVLYNLLGSHERQIR